MKQHEKKSEKSAPIFWRVVTALAATLFFGALTSCNARKDFPEPVVGWHSSNYGTLFGTLEKVPGPAGAPPTWLVRFGYPQETYSGALALTPPERLTGYSGGENIEVRGRIMTDPTTDAYNGRWYYVDSIQLWVNYR